MLPRAAAAAALLACVLAAPARAELVAWDQARVTELAKQLEVAAKALYDTFYKEPTPAVGQRRAYYQLKQDIRNLRDQARQLSAALAKNGGQEETAPIFDDLMDDVRAAREQAMQVFTTGSLQKRASDARAILNQLAPYYDPDAVPLQPVTR
jgi:hypothetical protein